MGGTHRGSISFLTYFHCKVLSVWVEVKKKGVKKKSHAFYFLKLFLHAFGIKKKFSFVLMHFTIKNYFCMHLAYCIHALYLVERKFYFIKFGEFC